MKVGAYLYAEGTPDAKGNRPPPTTELLNINYIDRFGVRAVFGRDVLSYKEAQSMVVAENIYSAYISRKEAMEHGNVAEWATKNPIEARLLVEVEKLLDAD